MEHNGSREKEPSEGGELTIAAMDEWRRAEICRKTYNFVRQCMQDPVLREQIKARAAEIRDSANE